MVPSGGAVGLSEDSAALRGRTVAGPDIARYVAAFEEDQMTG